MIKVMVTGHFDPFHDGHLDYFKQAALEADYLVCIVSSDRQLMMKKGRINIPETGRFQIVDLILRGLGINHVVYLNQWDTDTPSIARAIRWCKPDILFRGYDKRLEDMPMEERRACDMLGIKIMHAENRIGERHGALMKL